MKRLKIKEREVVVPRDEALADRAALRQRVVAAKRGKGSYKRSDKYKRRETD